jgi:putative N6-adenine-specific DNA methylase
VSLDSSGESLHKRGYRIEQGEAPLNEVLAAGMILKTGWRGETNFVDPMCGSGTLLIEAAMIALNIPPGLYRNEYGFERWPDFDSELFDEISQDESGERDFAFKCYGSDISPKAIGMAEENIKNAGLSRYIELQTTPFQQYTAAPASGILVTNPPYGERISTNDIINLYAMIGERLKHVFTGYQAWIISYKDECFEKIALRPSRKIKLMNGSLACEFRCYELFKGKNKDYKTALNDNKRFDRDRREPRKTFIKGKDAGLQEKGKNKDYKTALNDNKRFDRDRKENSKAFVKRKDAGLQEKRTYERKEKSFSKNKDSFTKRENIKEKYPNSKKRRLD